jgi:hypothetical protein
MEANKSDMLVVGIGTAIVQQQTATLERPEGRKVANTPLLYSVTVA